MRIDAHQHFWRYNDAEYGWMSADMDCLRRDHLPLDLAPLLGSAGLEGSVAVEARQTLAETEWLLELAGQYPLIKGVVGWVDLCSPQVDAQLERLAANPRLRGVRHVLHDEPDDRFMLRPDLIRGIGQLAGFGLTYDILIFPQHLPYARELAERLPEQPFVVDHIAKPRIREGLLDPWATDLRRLAELPNVCCKLSGMVTEADWQRWQPADFRPYLDLVLDTFGPQRLMIGSDWPVCTVAGAYEDVLGIVTDYIRALSPAEQDAILGGTACRFYGLAG